MFMCGFFASCFFLRHTCFPAYALGGGTAFFVVLLHCMYWLWLLYVCWSGPQLHIHFFLTDVVCPLIKAQMQQEGCALIGFQAVNGLPNFFRAVIPGAAVLGTCDIDAILETIARIGEKVALPPL